MTRRAWLAMAGGVLVAAAGGIVAISEGGRRRLAGGVRRLGLLAGRPGARLRSHYAWLRVEPSAFDRYLADWEEYMDPVERMDDPDPVFFTRFLLSTDFFADPARLNNADLPPVRYTEFFEPGTIACANPFARLPPTDEELALSTAGRTQGAVVRLG